MITLLILMRVCLHMLAYPNVLVCHDTLPSQCRLTRSLLLLHLFTYKCMYMHMYMCICSPLLFDPYT